MEAKNKGVYSCPWKTYPWNAADFQSRCVLKTGETTKPRTPWTCLKPSLVSEEEDSLLTAPGAQESQVVWSCRVLP